MPSSSARDDEARGRYAQSPDVDASTVADRVVLYHRRRRHAIVLNPMATWLWGLLGVPRSADDLVAEIRSHFPDVTEERASADLTGLLDELLRHEVVARTP